MRAKSRNEAVAAMAAGILLGLIAGCGAPLAEPELDEVSLALVTISESFDAVPVCYSEACSSGGAPCTDSFGQMISRSVTHPGDARNICVTESVFHGGPPGAGRTVSDTTGTSEVLYTKSSAASRTQIVSALFRFDGGLGGGTHVVVTSHAKWFQSRGGPDNTYNYGYAVGAGIAQGAQRFFLEDISLGRILYSVPYVFKANTWYRVRLSAGPTGSLQFYGWEWANGTWLLVASGATTTRSPVWLLPGENGGGMLGAVVETNHVDFDQFSLSAY